MASEANVKYKLWQAADRESMPSAVGCYAT